MLRWTCQARASYQLGTVFRDPPEFITSLLFSDLVGLALPPRRSSPFFLS